MLNPKWLLVLFLCCYIQFSLQQIPEGTPCYTPRNEYGLCVNIKKCVVLIELLRTQSSNESVRNYLRTSTCGYEGTTPMVCCPQTTPKGDSNENTSAESTTTKSEDDTRQGREKEAVLPISPECGFSNVTNSRVVGGMPAALVRMLFVDVIDVMDPVLDRRGASIYHLAKSDKGACSSEAKYIKKRNNLQSIH
ncbi:hypothetical protein NQ317_008967 [Molorchus minor]|uniref:Clip domain-containing protein n=1 Tax=Molorchus minor TaxID=1323400 RepID=A0ABQ9J2A3_9CUCU|nr:hypothetical protein NQ317_008967 [Molorchus minor]